MTARTATRISRSASQVLFTVVSIVVTAIAMLLLGPAGSARAHGEDDFYPVDEGFETAVKASDSSSALPVALIAGGGVLVVAVTVTALILRNKQKS
jgi:hypothetical protein